MTRKDQIKILDDKIKANNAQYDLDRMNAEISAYSSGDLPKYEYLTKKDLGYKPDAVEKVKFQYSPLGKVFTDGLAKEDKSKKVGLFKRLKNIEDNLVIPMFDLLEYSKNYRKTIGSLYNYYRDELSDDADDNNFDNIKVVNSEAFKYKNKIIGNTYNVNADNDGYDVNTNGTQEIELAIPLKYLGNFWRALNIPLISCEVSLELKWNKNCVITSLEEREVDAGHPVVRDNSPTGATLAINDCKLYIPVVTLSKDDEIKLVTNLKSGFKREII